MSSFSTPAVSGPVFFLKDRSREHFDAARNFPTIWQPFSSKPVLTPEVSGPTCAPSSSKPTEEYWHPSSLLPYDALLNRPAAGTGNDFYDRSLTGRRYALVGVACSSIIGCACIVAGTIIIHNHGVSGVAILYFPLFPDLMLNLIVTLCTESTGFVHGISLRSALASESRLRFNTNLRLMTAAGGWKNPNGALLNGIMAFLLIISYSSASFAICYDMQYIPTGTVGVYGIAGLPLLFLGVALLLQVAVALSGMWDSLVHHTQLTPVPFRCMRGVSELDGGGGPVKPSESQPSAWHAHPSIRKVVISLWGLVIACAGWAALVIKFTSSALTIQTWSFSPNMQQFGFINGMQSNNIWYTIPGVSIHGDALPEGKDSEQATNPLKAFFTSPLSLVLFVVKPFLHWMFGYSFAVSDYAVNGNLGTLTVHMFTAQIWNLCIALAIFACFFTVVALRRPHGPRPATYGHLQTLVNLVDEWSPVMWWGHKEDGIPYCHSGMGDHPLPDVKMDCVYAGSGVGFPVSVSSIIGGDSKLAGLPATRSKEAFVIFTLSARCSFPTPERDNGCNGLEDLTYLGFNLP
ncbi:hypothetical protein EDB19DRAFT_1970351 [Suillus lakei]|nr:hypothetical protein EDB19DRAFT_1970351 [Suillus lakei]